MTPAGSVRLRGMEDGCQAAARRSGRPGAGPVTWSIHDGTVALVVDGPLEGVDPSAMCRSLRAALEQGAVTRVVCQGDGLGDPDLGTVDLLARLQLVALRCGHQLRIVGASGELQGLVALTGLSEVLLPAGSGPGARWEAGQRDEPRGVDDGDPPDDRGV